MSNQQIIAKTCCYRLENGLIGGALLKVGQQALGEAIPAPNKVGWGCVRILTQTAYSLAQGKLWPPRCKAKPLLITTMNRLSWTGIGERDAVGEPLRGPFDLAPLTLSSLTAAYSALWKHDAKKEIHLICQPDSQLKVRPRMEEKAARIWKTAAALISTCRSA